MKARWVDIHIKVKTDAPLKLVRNAYRLNREVSEGNVFIGECKKYYNVEIHKVTVQVVKEGR